MKQPDAAVWCCAFLPSVAARLPKSCHLLLLMSCSLVYRHASPSCKLVWQTKVTAVSEAVILHIGNNLGLGFCVVIKSKIINFVNKLAWQS